MVTYSDTFDRADTPAGSGLGSTSTGARPWAVLTGSWRIASNRAVPAAASPVPIAVLELPGGDADASCIGSGGAALYARVKDAANWLRARVEYSSSTATTPYTYYTTTYNFYGTVRDSSPGSQSSFGATCSSSSPSGCSSASEYGYSASYYYLASRQQTGTSSQEHTGYSTSTVYSYVAVLEQCINGTVTEVARTSAGSTLSRLRLKLAGASAQLYYGAATTVAALSAAVVTALAGQSRHGIGLAPSTIQEGYVNDYSVEVLNTAPGAPTTTAPASGSSISNATPLRHAWAFTDPDVGDDQASFTLQYRVTGTTNATTVTETTSNRFWDAPAGTLSGGIDFRVKVTDKAGGESPYSEWTSYTVTASGGSGPGGGASGGGGGTGVTPLQIAALVQLAVQQQQLDELTALVMEAQS